MNKCYSYNHIFQMYYKDEVESDGHKHISNVLQLQGYLDKD